jgi:hypothetical protein
MKSHAWVFLAWLSGAAVAHSGVWRYTLDGVDYPGYFRLT